MSLTTSTLRRSPIALSRPANLPHPERAVSRGDAVRVRRGVYADAAEWRALAPWDRYLAEVHAVAMTRPDAVFSHESAAVLSGLPVFGRPEFVHVLDEPYARARGSAGVRTHTTHGERRLMELGGLILTAPCETAVDIARSRHPAAALAVADAALRADPLLTVDTLRGCNESRISSRGRARAREPLAGADGAAESPLESVSRAAIGWLGFAKPMLQVSFPDGSGSEDRCDFWWPGVGVVGESDGDIKLDQAVLGDGDTHGDRARGPDPGGPTTPLEPPG